MRFYVASGLENFARVQEVAAHLRALGHDQVYDWTTHGDVRHLGDARMAEVAQNEVDAVMGAEFVLALLPGGRGTHTEIGLAIASAVAGKTEIWVYSENGTHFASDDGACTFYFHPAIRRMTGHFEGLLRELDAHFGVTT